MARGGPRRGVRLTADQRATLTILKKYKLYKSDKPIRGMIATRYARDLADRFIGLARERERLLKIPGEPKRPGKRATKGHAGAREVGKSISAAYKKNYVLVPAPRDGEKVTFNKRDNRPVYTRKNVTGDTTYRVRMFGAMPDGAAVWKELRKDEMLVLAYRRRGGIDFLSFETEQDLMNFLYPYEKFAADGKQSRHRFRTIEEHDLSFLLAQFGGRKITFKKA